MVQNQREIRGPNPVFSPLQKQQSHDDLFNYLNIDPKFFGEFLVNDYIIDIRRIYKTARHLPLWKNIGSGLPGKLGEHLYGIVRTLKPALIVETGVAMGMSSAFFLAALLENKTGQLISVDVVKDAGLLVNKDLYKHWIFCCAKSSAVLPRLNVNEIDIFCHDSLHTYENMLFEYEWAYPRLKDGGLLISHDANIKDSPFFDFAQDHNEEIYFIKSSNKGFSMGAIIKGKE